MICGATVCEPAEAWACFCNGVKPSMRAPVYGWYGWLDSPSALPTSDMNGPLAYSGMFEV